jgi:hypothetical protein
MSRMPVTLADQPVVLDPEDADELTDLLADAAWVIGHLAGQPAAEEACARAPARPGSCADLAMDLRLAAAGLDEAATAGQENHYISAHCRKQASPGGKRPRQAPENQHSEKGK